MGEGGTSAEVIYMTLNEKIKYIDKYVDHRASFTHFRRWDFCPFNNGIFAPRGKIGTVSDPDFEALCDKVIALIEKEEAKK